MKELHVSREDIVGGLKLHEDCKKRTELAIKLIRSENTLTNIERLIACILEGKDIADYAEEIISTRRPVARTAEGPAASSGFGCTGVTAAKRVDDDDEDDEKEEEVASKSSPFNDGDAYDDEPKKLYDVVVVGRNCHWMTLVASVKLALDITMAQAKELLLVSGSMTIASGVDWDRADRIARCVTQYCDVEIAVGEVGKDTDTIYAKTGRTFTSPAKYNLAY